MSQAARLPFHRVPGVSHVHMLVLTGVEGLIAGDPVDRDQHPVQDRSRKTPGLTMRPAAAIAQHGLYQRNHGGEGIFGPHCRPRPHRTPLPVHAPHHRVDGRDRRDHVGEVATFTQHGNGLHMMERGVAEMRAVGPGAAVADQMAAELALR